MDHFTLRDNYAPGIPYQKQEENTHLVKLTPFPDSDEHRIGKNHPGWPQ